MLHKNTERGVCHYKPWSKCSGIKVEKMFSGKKKGNSRGIDLCNSRLVSRLTNTTSVAKNVTFSNVFTQRSLSGFLSNAFSGPRMSIALGRPLEPLWETNPKKEHGKEKKQMKENPEENGEQTGIQLPPRSQRG